CICSVGALAFGASGCILDASGATDEDEARHEVWLLECEVQHEAGTHRIAEVGGMPASVGHEARAGVQGSVNCGRLAMTRRVQPHHFVIAGEVGPDRSPAVPVLCEPMDEHETRTATVDFHVEHAFHTCTKMDGWRPSP